ncbi:nitroreductase family deazaflavin-dependent oxidoreductase [Mycolicibacterium palauense]|uniref:nitroreductase family deazaflavin-dependent oxidoreductase n=1 Tax=Mycolicibacterium palauense TaxID=2034511 RepID=UPI000BFEBA44|nr:nitroreductase family deazaflavin-dependent oxidoreductase [Mycolicibacterium palauense]
MRAREHPNHTAEVPMVFPPWLERLQIRYFNPLIGPAARHLPGFAVIKHHGRKSGTPYETVVSAYRKGDVVAVMLAHGKTNWVKNVLAAGEADMNLARRDVHLVNPRIVPAGGDAAGLPRVARMGARRVGVFVADIDPGPSAR